LDEYLRLLPGDVAGLRNSGSLHQSRSQWRYIKDQAFHLLRIYLDHCETGASQSMRQFFVVGLPQSLPDSNQNRRIGREDLFQRFYAVAAEITYDRDLRI
jgi:hypothetical protein